MAKTTTTTVKLPGTKSRKILIQSRRRIHDDGGEEDQEAPESEIGSAEDESSVGASMLSDDSEMDEEDEDARDDAGALSQDSPPETNDEKDQKQNLVNGDVSHSPVENKDLGYNDTRMMVNGVQPQNEDQNTASTHVNGAHSVEEHEAGGPRQGDAIDANLSGPRSQASGEARESARQISRQEERDAYARRRANDPAFVPNRGGFFMHDQRSAGSSSGRGRGRGRGRGSAGHPDSSYSSSRPSRLKEAVENPWLHDLHETVAYPERVTERKEQTRNHIPPKAASKQSRQQDRNQNLIRSSSVTQTFSKILRLGRVHLQIRLPFNTTSIILKAVPINNHITLPDHRSVLRRDRPVRIYLLMHTKPVFLFPPTHLSFISLSQSQKAIAKQESARSATSHSSAPNSTMTPSATLTSQQQNLDKTSAQSPTVNGDPLLRKGSILTPTAPAVSSLGNADNLSHPLDTGVPIPVQPTTDTPIHHPRPGRSLQVNSLEAPTAQAPSTGLGVDLSAMLRSSSAQRLPSHAELPPFHQQMPPQFSPQAYPTPPLSFPPHSRQQSNLESPAISSPSNVGSLQQQHISQVQAYPQSHVSRHPRYSPATPAYMPQGYHPLMYPTAYPYTHPYQFHDMYPNTTSNAPYNPAAMYYYNPSAAQNYMIAGNPLNPASAFFPTNSDYSAMMAAPSVPQPTGQADIVAQERGGMVYYYKQSALDTASSMPGSGPIPKPDEALTANSSERRANHHSRETSYDHQFPEFIPSASSPSSSLFVVAPSSTVGTRGSPRHTRVNHNAPASTTSNHHSHSDHQEYPSADSHQQAKPPNLHASAKDFQPVSQSYSR